MKQLSVKSIPLAVALIVTACDNSGNQNKVAPSEKNDGHDHAAMEQNTEQPAARNVSIKDDRLHAVYQQYITLTNALVAGNVGEAKIASNAIEAGAHAMPGGTEIAASADKITAASSLEAQRTAYSKLSDDLIDLIKKSGLNGGALYVNFCPMAMNNKGAFWLSNAAKIKNPYYGNEMLTCGEVKETIKE